MNDHNIFTNMILLPILNEEFNNLQEEINNIMISNTTQDLALIQLQSGLTTATGNIVFLGVLAETAKINALAAIDLANQKSWNLFFQKPLRSTCLERLEVHHVFQVKIKLISLQDSHWDDMFGHRKHFSECIWASLNWKHRATFKTGFLAKKMYIHLIPVFLLHCCSLCSCFMAC
jgi:hypothetical protein